MITGSKPSSLASDLKVYARDLSWFYKGLFVLQLMDTLFFDSC